MIELDKKQHSISKTDSQVFAKRTANNKVISIEECRGYFSSSKVSDETIRNIRNNLVGVVDSIINSYLEDYR